MNLMGKLSSHGPDSSCNSRNSHNATGSHVAAVSANVIRNGVRTVVACTATVAALTALAVPSSAVAAESANEPYQLGTDGTTKPVYSYKDAIREYVYIEIPDDGDGDGKNDLIRADIIRPSELNDGRHNVPIIMDPSPYFGYADLGRGNESEIKLYENEQDKANSPETQFPLYYDNYFVPRGYAYVLPDLAGTNLSEGCGDIGGKYDLDSAKAVVDWANGRAKAYKSKTAPRDAANEVKADWASGKVASFGKSYDGSVTDGLAATGVEGLTTIVPISGISNQYNWYRAGTGALYANWWEPGPFADYLATAEPGASDHSGKTVCKAHVEQMIKDEDATTRNYNDFWKERDYASHVKDFKASVFLVHGVNDLNVQMNNVDKYWAALQANHVPSKIWLSQDGHDDPFDFRRTDWVNEIHRWFDYWLFGIDNGVMNEPQASVENSDGTWSDYASWPVPGARDVTMSFAKGDVDGLGTLSEGTPAASSTPIEASFKGGRVDELTGDAPSAAYSLSRGASGADDADATRSAAADSLVSKQATGVQPFSADSDGSSSDAGATPEYAIAKDTRLLYVGQPLAKDTHISGTPKIRLSVKATAPDTNLSFSLIDYGSATRIEADPSTLHALITDKTQPQDCVGDSVDGRDDACYYRTVENKVTADSYVISRGWVSTAHKDSLDALTPTPVNQYYDITWDGLATDYTVPAGHRLGIAIYNNSTRMADVPLSDFTVDLSKSTVTVPIVSPSGNGEGNGGNSDSGNGGAGDNGGAGNASAGAGNGGHSANAQGGKGDSAKPLSNTGFDAAAPFGMAMALLVAAAGLIVVKRRRDMRE